MAAYRYLRWGGVDPRRERIMVPQSSKIDGLGQKHLGRFWPILLQKSVEGCREQ